MHWVLPVLVFVGRFMDVTLGTMRTILLVRGKAAVSAMVGFLELIIWFLIVRNALTSAENGLLLAVCYAGGYACGTLLGSRLVRKLFKSNVGVQIVTDKNDELIHKIRDAGYGISIVDSKGSDLEETKYMLFIEIEKGKLNQLRKLVTSVDKSAFIVVHETSYVQNGFFK